MDNKIIEQTNSIHSAVEIEKSILGYILDKQSMQNVFGHLMTKDFYDPKHQIIFEALSTLANDYEDHHLELSVVIQYLSDQKLLEKIGGSTYLAELITQAALEANIPKHIKQVDEKSRLRRLQSDFAIVSRELSTKRDLTVDNLTEQVEMQILSSIRNTEIKGFEDAPTLANRAITIIEKKAAGEVLSGIKSGFSELDKITSGFQRGDLIILAARPSMGKTALALNIAINIAKHEQVAFFSVEMPSMQIMNRVFSSLGMVDANKLISPQSLTPMENKKLYYAKDQTDKLQISIDDTPGIKLTDVIWKAKQLHKNSPLSLIVIDYLQLITVANSSGVENRQAEVSQISRSLKKLARELNVPIIALSQLSRKVEQRESKVPMMSDLRESGAIEQDADLVAFVYREDYYKNDEEKSIDETQKVEIIIGKHRNGATGKIALAFEPRYGLFSNFRKDQK